MRGRLVGHDHRRVLHERARNGDTLLLAARHLRRGGARPLGETDDGEELFGARGRGGALAGPRETQRRHDVALGGEARQQVERLEHHADRVLPVARDVLTAEADGLVAPELDRARRRGEQPGEARKQRRLPAAARTEHHHELAVLGVERQVIERPDHVAVGLELDGQLPHFELGHHGPATRSRDQRTPRAAARQGSRASRSPRPTRGAARPRWRRDRDRLRKHPRHEVGQEAAERGGHERYERGLHGQARVQHRRRRAQRLQHREVARTLQRRDVHERGNDDRGDHPHEHARVVDGRSRGGHLHEALVPDLLVGEHHRARGQIAWHVAREDGTHERPPAERHRLGVGKRHVRVRRAAQQREPARGADHLEPLAAHRERVAAPDMEAAVDDGFTVGAHHPAGRERRRTQLAGDEADHDRAPLIAVDLRGQRRDDHRAGRRTSCRLRDLRCVRCREGRQRCDAAGDTVGHDPRRRAQRLHRVVDLDLEARGQAAQQQGHREHERGADRRDDESPRAKAQVLQCNCEHPRLLVTARAARGQAGSDSHGSGQRDRVAGSHVAGHRAELVHSAVVPEHVVGGERDLAQARDALLVAARRVHGVARLGRDRDLRGRDHVTSARCVGQARIHLEVHVRPAAGIARGEDRRERRDTGRVGGLHAAEVVLLGGSVGVERIAAFSVAVPHVHRRTRYRLAGVRVEDRERERGRHPVRRARVRPKARRDVAAHHTVLREHVGAVGAVTGKRPGGLLGDRRGARAARARGARIRCAAAPVVGTVLFAARLVEVAQPTRVTTPTPPSSFRSSRRSIAQPYGCTAGRGPRAPDFLGSSCAPFARGEGGAREATPVRTAPPRGREGDGYAAVTAGEGVDRGPVPRLFVATTVHR